VFEHAKHTQSLVGTGKGTGALTKAAKEIQTPSGTAKRRQRVNQRDHFPDGLDAERENCLETGKGAFPKAEIMLWFPGVSHRGGVVYLSRRKDQGEGFGGT